MGNFVEMWRNNVELCGGVKELCENRGDEGELCGIVGICEGIVWKCVIQSILA